MSRNWELFLNDIEISATKIMRYTQDMNLQTFIHNELVYDAVLRNLEIIGEATKQIPPEIRQRFPSINWRGITGLRDILAHAYFALDDETLWDIVKNKVPILLNAIQNYQNLK